MVISFAVVLFLGVALNLQEVRSHGKLWEPPNRSSIWRFPEFANRNPEPNYTDNELFCGGFAVQHNQNGGRCGECGDRWDAARPRDNELGGKYGAGVIVREYTSGQLIDIVVDLSAAHLGYFEFKLCPERRDSQECLDRHLLRLEGGGTRLPVTNGPTIYRTKAYLPQGVRCDHCVLQWHYHCGNAWGQCQDGSSALGCGPQETFRGCADIRIR